MEVVRLTDNFRLILRLHNVQIMKKKYMHAAVLLSWLQNGTFNSYFHSTLLGSFCLIRSWTFVDGES